MGEFMKIKLLVLLMMGILGTTSAFAVGNCDIEVPGADKDAIATTVNACDYEGEDLTGFDSTAVTKLTEKLKNCKCDVNNKEIAESPGANATHCSSGRTAKLDTETGNVIIEQTPGATITRDN